MSALKPEINDEILRRRAAGETFPDIGKAMGMKTKSVQSAYARAMKRAARPAKPAKSAPASTDAPAAIEQPGYDLSKVRAVKGYGPTMRPYAAPVVLRLNAARAAAVQPAMMSMASSAHGSEGVV